MTTSIVPTYILRIHGPFPSKKQRGTPRKNPKGGKGFFYKEDIRAQIDAVTWQLKSQWVDARAALSAEPLLPLRNPEGQCGLGLVDHADSRLHAGGRHHRERQHETPS